MALAGRAALCPTTRVGLAGTRGPCLHSDSSPSGSAAAASAAGFFAAVAAAAFAFLALFFAGFVVLSPLFRFLPLFSELPAPVVRCRYLQFVRWQRPSANCRQSSVLFAAGFPGEAACPDEADRFSFPFALAFAMASVPYSRKGVSTTIPYTSASSVTDAVPYRDYPPVL